MNYPDLETCKAIGGEFEDSEFVWVETPISKTTCIYHRKGQYIKSQLAAPAPTCEELGAWLARYMLRKANSSHFELLLAHQTKFLKSMNAALFTGYMVGGSDNETQARAEVVKLLLEEK